MLARSTRCQPSGLYRKVFLQSLASLSKAGSPVSAWMTVTMSSPSSLRVAAELATSDVEDRHTRRTSGRYPPCQATSRLPWLSRQGTWCPRIRSRVSSKGRADGTRFFAHSRRRECTSTTETHEHLPAKSLIARVAQDAGWAVTTELRGVTPTGEAWVADVHAHVGIALVAFEVQWSAQTLEETVARQARYAASGVRALWLLRQGEDDVLSGQYDRQARPMFTLRFAEGRSTVGPFNAPVGEFSRVP